MTSAADGATHRRCLDQCLGHIRGARWKIQTAVRTAARQEPGRPRVARAAEWWAAEVRTIEEDPVLSWARDAGADGPEVEAPETEAPESMLARCIAHCGDLYDRALRTWS